MAGPLLELSGVTKKFGSVVAVDDVSLTVDEGGITALIGPNGAGKTTLYKLITGDIDATDGDIRFRGTRLNAKSSSERTELGLGRSFQITNIFEDLTVRQNLRVPVIGRSSDRWNPFGRVENNREINEETDRLLELVGLEEYTDAPAKNLSYGDKRKVEVGIALATDPELLLLDEPTAGMNPVEKDEMTDLISFLHEETGTKIFFTEHDMGLVFSIPSRILVLHKGQIIADGTPKEIQDDSRVISAYLGEQHESA